MSAQRRERGFCLVSRTGFRRDVACPRKRRHSKPKSIWRKAFRLHPLIPRETKRWGDLYRGRGSVERAFGRLKHEHGLAPLRVRGRERVALHADLCILATLAQALARARAVPWPLRRSRQSEWQALACALVRCEACERTAEGSAKGWIAVRVDLPDDSDPPEIVIYCPACFAREFGDSFASRNASPS